MALRSPSETPDIDLFPDLSNADADGVRIESTSSGPTASVRTPDGRWVRLHSGRDPVAEADRDVARLLEGGTPPAIICIGVGLGYVLDALERRAPATRVLAIEPCPAAARAMALRRSWRDWFTSRRLTLLVGPAYIGAADAWRCLDGEVPAPVVVAPVLEREFPAEIARARTIARDASFGARANAEARRRFAPRYLLNTLRNVPVIGGSADVAALFDTLPGVPAVVVGAGPSLDTNLDALRELADRAIIIAVDTAARPLLSAGIAPHLVVALDPSETNARHLRYLPDPGDTWLVAEGSLHPSAFEQFHRRTFTFAVADHHPWPWLRSVGLQRGRLRAWGSVLTSAFDLALRVGCDPIVFAGADLSFTGGRPYCRGTTFEHEWARRVATGESLDEVWRSILGAKEQLQRDDVTGAAVPTAPQLLAFRDWLVEQTRQATTRRFINASGAGVLEGGRIEQQSLRQALAGAESAGGRARAAVRAAWKRGPGGHPDSGPLSRVRQAVTHIEPRGEPMDTWLAFGGYALTPGAVGGALSLAMMEGRDARSASVAEQMPMSAFRRDAPERVAMLRSALTNQVAAAGSSPTRRPVEVTPQPLTHALERASRALAALLRRSDLIDPDVLAVAPVHLPGIPASRALPWSAVAVGMTLEFEAALADVLTHGPDARHPEASRAIQRLGAALVRIEVPECHAPSVSTPQDVADLTGHLALLLDWALVLVRLGGPRTWIPPLRVSTAVLRSSLEALRRGTSAAAQALHDHVEVTIAGRRHVLVGDRMPLSGSLTEGLTGALVHVSPGNGMSPVSAVRAPSIRLEVPDGANNEIEVSVSFFPIDRGTLGTPVNGPRWLCAARTASPSVWVEPVMLTGPRLRACMVGSTLDGSRALFATVNGTYGIRIDAAGDWMQDVAWPSEICGQVAWQGSGAVAWHNRDTSNVMWRDHPDGDVRTERIPFVASLAFPQDDGEIWWTAFSGGLWSWRPGGAWHRLVDSPPLMALQRTPAMVRLEPAGGVSRFSSRPETHAYRWTPGSDAVEPEPLGPEGPCWSSATSGAWTASAYPQSDAVLLRHRDGTERVLTCTYPFNLAWAGSSLVISTGTGELMLFRNLIATLDMEL